MLPDFGRYRQSVWIGSAGDRCTKRRWDNVRGRILTLATGLLAAGALLFTGLNFNLLQRNPEQADQWQRHT